MPGRDYRPETQHVKYFKNLGLGTKMKITKRQLKRIIREEKIKLLNESAMPNSATGMVMVKAVTDGVMNYLIRDVFRPEDLDGDLKQIREDIRNILYKIVAEYTNDYNMD